MNGTNRPSFFSRDRLSPARQDRVPRSDMRSLLLLAGLLTTASCSTPTDVTAPRPATTINPTATTAGSGRSATPTIQDSTAPEAEPAVGIDVQEPSRNGPSRPIASTVTTVEPGRSHRTEPTPISPLPLPDPPDPTDDPVDIFTWVGTAMLNYGPNQTFALGSINQFLAPPLADQLATNPPLSVVDAGVGSRTVLIDAWIDDDVSTTTSVTGIVVFERTLNTASRALPGFELVHLKFTAHKVDGGWQTVQITSTAT